MHCSPCPTALVTEVQFWVLPGKPSVVSSLHSDGENVGLSLGQLFLPGEILSAHRSPSGGFGLFSHLIPLGSCSLITASKAGSCGGGPRGEHHPTKAVRKLPPCQEPRRALCPLAQLPQHSKIPGMLWVVCVRADVVYENDQCNTSASPLCACGPK